MSDAFRFAPLGSDAFNRALGDALEEVARSVRRSSGDALAGLVLSGGYGRGEGAVVRSADGGERAWNDVDLVPVARTGRAADLRRAVASARGEVERFAARFGADLDFGRVIEEADIRRLPPVLLWLETARGHRVIGGDPELFRRNLAFDPGQQPAAIEGTKLLLNRGAGLLMALAKAGGMPTTAFDVSDPAFVRRNAAKCSLALGDALLMAAGCYETRASRKLAAFAAARPSMASAFSGQVEALASIAVDYGHAVAFRTEPGRFPGEPEPGRLAEIADLWVLAYFATEQLRTGRRWDSPSTYAAHAGLVEPAEHRGLRTLARNVAHNARLGRIGTRYPRERLFRELPCLLARSREIDRLPRERLDAFVRLWRRYS